MTIYNFVHEGIFVSSFFRFDRTFLPHPAGTILIPEKQPPSNQERKDNEKCKSSPVKRSVHLSLLNSFIRAGRACRGIHLSGRQWLSSPSFYSLTYFTPFKAKSWRELQIRRSAETDRLRTIFFSNRSGACAAADNQCSS